MTNITAVRERRAVLALEIDSLKRSTAEAQAEINRLQDEIENRNMTITADTEALASMDEAIAAAEAADQRLADLAAVDAPPENETIAPDPTPEAAPAPGEGGEVVEAGAVEPASESAEKAASGFFRRLAS